MNKHLVTDEVIEKIIEIDFKVEELGYSEIEAYFESHLTEEEYKAGREVLHYELTDDDLRIDGDVVDEDEVLFPEPYPYENPLTLANYYYDLGYSEEQIAEAVASYFGWNED